MVSFLQLVPDLRPLSPVLATDGCCYRSDYVKLKLDGCYFLSNYDGDSLASDSSSSDCDDSECGDGEDRSHDMLLDDDDAPTGALLHLLTNSLVFAHIAPFLSARDKFNLAATSKALHALVRGTPFVFKYLDLTRLQCQRQRATADSVVSTRNSNWCDGPHRPYHDVFDHLHSSRWLASVNTLILDHTHVDADLVHSLLTSPVCNVRLLSLRCTPSLNKDALRRHLKELCDSSQTPKLKGLYVFGDNEAPASYNTDPWSGTRDHPLPRVGDSTSDLWYRTHGRVLTAGPLSGDDWAATLADCRGKIAFDGVLCSGPRHTNSPAFGTTAGLDMSNAVLGQSRIPLSRLPLGAPHAGPAMATVSLGGCAGCGSAPEGWTTWGDDDQLPLLWPPPRLSANVRVAMCPDDEPLHPRRAQAPASASASRFIARCEWCVYGRLCACCMRWWCERCLPDSAVHGMAPGVDGVAEPVHKPLMTYSCRECGPTCPDCLVKTAQSCAKCRQSYCAVHNEGCTSTHCDWCSVSMFRSQLIRRAAPVSRF